MPKALNFFHGKKFYGKVRLIFKKYVALLVILYYNIKKRQNKHYFSFFYKNA